MAAIRPNAYGSSTIGVKKSTVCTIASSSVSWTTPASSAVSAATSTRGSVGRGQSGDDRAQVGGRELAAAAGAVGEGGEGDGHRVRMMAAQWPDRRAYTDAEVEAAVQALTDPARLEEAQRVVARERAGAAAHPQPGARGGGAGSAPRISAQVLEAAGKADIEERLHAVRRLLAEETRVSDADRRGGRASSWPTSSSTRRRAEHGSGRPLARAFLPSTSPEAAARRAHRPVPDRQPEGRGDAPTRSPADVILLTHGHGDHLGDTVDIAKRTGATVRGDRRARGRDRGRRRRGRRRPQLRRHGQLRLGLGQARPRLAHRGLARAAPRTCPPAC